MIVTIESITESEKGKKVEGNKDDGKRVTFYVNSRTEQENPFDMGTYDVTVKKFGDKFWATQITPSLGDSQRSTSIVDKTPQRGEGVGGMTKDDWAEKDRLTRKSIERQKSLELAVNLVIADKIPLNEASPWTKKFEKYLETGGDSRLVQEAKKMGAIEE